MTPNTKCIIVIQETCDKHIPIMKHSLKELKRPSRLVKQAAIRSTAGCPIRNSNFLTFASNWVHPRLLGWFRVAYYFSFLLVFFIYYFCLSSSWGLSAHGCKCQCLWIVHKDVYPHLWFPKHNFSFARQIVSRLQEFFSANIMISLA